VIGAGYQDAPELNFHPILGLISRQRYAIILSLLPEKHFPRLLEIGYGSGIFQPELAQRCESLYGVDIHPYGPRVFRQLRGQDIGSSLIQGSGTSLPFKEQMFDCVVAMSCIEYMDPLDDAAQEIRKVLKSDGSFILVTPGNSPVIDFFHDLITGRPVRDGYGDRRSSLISTFLKYFVMEEQIAVPRFGGSLATLYLGFRLRPA